MSYVGSSTDIEKRWNQHLSTLRMKRHASQTLQDAWNASDANAFVMETLELVTDEDVLAERESYHIERYWPNVYNVRRQATRQVVPQERIDDSAHEFYQFHAAVVGRWGRRWGERRVRAALNALKLSPLPTQRDARRKLYPPEWVALVRAYLKAEDNELRSES